MNDRFVKVAKLVGEPARAAMLLKLMSGRALPAGELAAAANVTPQTASEHLSRLMEGGLVAVHRQGRHRYYRLSKEEVGNAVESLMVLSLDTAEESVKFAPPGVGTLAHARTCYSHLAGFLGVSIAEALQQNHFLIPTRDQCFVVTCEGAEWFQKLGVKLDFKPGRSDKTLARQCMDWTERRPHVAGKLGLALLKRLLELGWLASIPETRVLRVTVEGRKALHRELGISI